MSKAAPGAVLDRFDEAVVRQPGLRVRIACPSQEFVREEMALGVGRWRSCVRGLWESLALPGDRRLALVMLQAQPVPTGVLRYLFGLRGDGPAVVADCLVRHAFVSIDDDREQHLSEKLLDRPELVERLRTTVRRARERGHVVEGLAGYAASPRMDRLAASLGVDLVETPTATLVWGTKTGSREIFRRAGVDHPPGAALPPGSAGALSAVEAGLRRQHSAGSRWLVKLDSGYGSGHGNALLTAGGEVRPFSTTVTPSEFVRRLDAVGGVVEQLLDCSQAGPPRSPSALAFIDREGRANLLGTHEQLIGPEQDFVGCRFPADPAYRERLITATHAVLAELIRQGVRGHVGVDFLARPPNRDPSWRLDALEVNLRQTGSVHPNRTAHALVGGRWTPDGRLVRPDGREVVYTATDGLINSSYRGITPERLLTKLDVLSYDRRTGRGVVPHLWSTLEIFGKVGATFIGSSTDECDELSRRFVGLLEELRVL